LLPVRGVAVGAGPGRAAPRPRRRRRLLPPEERDARAVRLRGRRRHARPLWRRRNPLSAGRRSLRDRQRELRRVGRLLQRVPARHRLARSAQRRVLLRMGSRLSRRRAPARPEPRPVLTGGDARALHRRRRAADSRVGGRVVGRLPADPALRPQEPRARASAPAPGALLFNRMAEVVGTKRAIMVSLVIWTVTVTYAYGWLRTGAQFVVLAAVIAIVLGGSQALSRALYSHMIPRGQEAEYFSLYEVSERGTSWLGPFLFGLALQLTGSYRIAILSLSVFFLLGLAVLAHVDVKRAVVEAGNEPPAKL